ncbi:homoserine kinase [Nocardioides cavernae]|uniref:Homoserine kinase n=1 Tax=Nocardioides cavernae TaxID=1921566 RepID=A0A7Y9H4C5_9ACTN|nr:homoserine kinase [Nocardioides cavernae]NYE37712.1 homoserine kinase [Nocardioides cavernae]
MAQFVDGPVRVTVPATSANLGPGFDSLGLALSLRDELEAEVLPHGLEVEVDGAGADGVPRDESHLVVRSMRAAFDLMGEQPPGLRLSCRNVIPHARGLGSSSAAIVAGVVLARALVAGGQLLASDETLFDLAADLEGHPDNVAPAFYGGFVISGREDDRWYAVRAGVDPRITAVVFVPPTGVETKVARGLLPDSVPHADAAANAGRAALLVAALTGQPEHLLAATRDWLHQDQREPAMPATLALVRALRADGVPAVVSGAGPTVLAFGSADTSPLTARCPDGWACHDLAVEPSGALVL